MAGNQGTFDFHGMEDKVIGCFVPSAGNLGIACPLKQGYECGCEAKAATLTWVDKSRAVLKCAKKATYRESPTAVRTICRVKQTTQNTLQYYFGHVLNERCVFSDMAPETLGRACTQMSSADYDVLCEQGGWASAWPRLLCAQLCQSWKTQTWHTRERAALSATKQLSQQPLIACRLASCLQSRCSLWSSPAWAGQRAPTARPVMRCRAAPAAAAPAEQ